MNINNLKFESLPNQVASLEEEVKAIRELLLQKWNLPNEEERVIGLEEVCRLTGYAKNTVYQYVNKNKIPYYKPEHGGRKLFFYREEIENWLKGRKPETAEDYCQRKELELINSMKGGLN